MAGLPSSVARPRENAIRMADVLGAFSLAGDLAVGLQPEHGTRSCYIGMRIAQALGLGSEDRINLYYAELLKDAGCTAYTSQLATLWLTDEIVAKRELLFLRDFHNPADILFWLMQYVAAGAPLATRATRMLDFLKDGQGDMREGFESTCQMAARIAHRLGMPDAVQNALMNVFEEWDGRGMPQGRRGGSIPIISRIVLVTSYLDIFHRIGGREAAQRLARERRGKAFDPSVVDAFLSVGQEEGFWEGLEHERVWETVLSLEPEESPHKYIGEEKLTDVALCFADYADMKSPYMLGHSRRVADIAVRIARRMLISDAQILDIYRAALVHDIGVVAVPSFVLNQPRERLTEAAAEQVRLHPYYSERILSRVPAFHAIIPSVAAHHERIDGQGYHRGLPGAQIPLPAQIIAVADRFDDLTHDQPDHPALEVDEALGIMRQEAGPGLAPDAFRALAEELGGLTRPTRQRAHQHEWPAGLTDREVEVLRAVAKGLNRQEAAKALFVSEGTVRSHLEHIYTKIGVSNRSGATLFAVEHGLLP